MNNINLTYTNATVSSLCLGCLNFGSRTNPDEAKAILNRFTEVGGNFLDTANNYAFWNENAKGGESETFLGEWMQARKNRHQLFLATKCGAMPTDLTKGFDTIEGLSKQAIEKAIDQSLRRLQTDYIDLYYAHITDPTTPLEEMLETFNALIQSGKVHYIGCSNFSLAHLKEAQAICETHHFQPISCVQQRYSFLQPKTDADFGIQKIADAEMVDYCAHETTPQLLAYSPLLNGYYNTKVNLSEQYQHENTVHQLKVLDEIAKALGATPCQVVLAWMLQRPFPVIPLVASSSLKQFEENLGALDVQLSPAQIEALNASLS